MNIETANRLLKLRKEHNLSQEELAQKLNISRQAVSKWERAEASPDTDKLIDLAELYGVTVDELLSGSKEKKQEESETNANSNTDDSHNTQNEQSKTTEAPNNNDNTSYNNKSEDGRNSYEQSYKDKVNFKHGIHVHSANGDKVDIGLDGIHVVEKGKDKVHIGFDGINVFDDEGENISEDYFSRHKDESGNWNWNGNQPININVKQKPTPTIYKILYAFPFPLFAIIAFACIGIFVDNGWTFSWLSFLTIPLYYTAVSAFKHRNLNIFCYPVLMAIIFFGLGIIEGIWGYSWLVFLTIPFYYWIGESINKLKKQY